MSEATGFEVVLCIAAVASGAMFGDNLSMISDTTIAAVRTQGCEMKDKFRMNFFIVLPAAILTLVIFIALTWGGSGQPEIGTYSVWKVLPYLVVLVGAVAGVNVFLIPVSYTHLDVYKRQRHAWPCPPSSGSETQKNSFTVSCSPPGRGL